MDYIYKNFYFDNDIVITSSSDEYGNMFPASLKANDGTYALRSFGLVLFNANESGDPLIEIDYKIRDKATDNIFDPLFAIILTKTDEYSARLYYCHNIGDNYVELASYKDLFLEDYDACYDGLCNYRDGKDIGTMDSLKSLMNKAIMFMQDKVLYLKSQ